MYRALSSGICWRARMAQNVTRSLILIAGRAGEDLIRARRASKPAASAEAFRVYCAVVDKDSRMRRAILSRMLEGRGARVAGGAGAAAEAGRAAEGAAHGRGGRGTVGAAGRSSR